VSDEDQNERARPPGTLDRSVAEQERRKLRARQQQSNPLSVGFAAFGVIGWSVAVPTVTGVALGVWLDRVHPEHFSWTLMLLGVGIFMGCLNAWHWMARENRRIRSQSEERERD
jgi:ATP synthase protein I